MVIRQSTTFEVTDKFGLAGFAARLEAFIATEHHFVEGGLVISLNGAFGLGKSTFLEMWCHQLSARRKQGDPLPIPIILNAWESDYCGDPLLAIVSAVSAVLGESEEEKVSHKAGELREAVKDVANFTLGMAGGFAKHLSGLDPLAAAKFAEDKKKSRKTAPKHHDLLAAYEGKLSALAHLKEVLTSAFGGDKPNAIVMVDELDRCRPSYAVEYLEMIKHVFNIHGLVFVLAVDRGQLRSSAKALFGADLEFDEYYRKFAHRNVDLPSPTQQGLANLAAHYASTILEVKNPAIERSSMLNVEGRLTGVAEVAAGLKLTPRQIHEVFRVMGHALNTTPEKRGRLNWGFGAGTILMSALSVAKPELYRKLGTVSAAIEDFELILNLFPRGSDRESWAMIIYSRYCSDKEETNENLLQDFVRVGIFAPELAAKEGRQSLGRYATGWGGSYRSEPGLKYVYEVLEGVNSFAV